MLLENFQTTFNYVADIHAPLQSRKVRNRKAPWLTDAIKKSMNRRDYLKKKAIKTNSTACHNAYKSLRNEINKKLCMQSEIITQTVLTETEIIQSKCGNILIS